MADRNTPKKDGIEIGLAVAASTKIEAGHMVAVNAAGYAVHASDTAGLKVMGRAQETVDNTSGANGDKTVLILRKKMFKFANDSTNAVAQAHVGGNVYVKDSVTVDSDGGTNDIVAGKCFGVETDGVWVEI
jgi:hypothetical protein